MKNILNKKNIILFITSAILLVAIVLGIIWGVVGLNKTNNTSNTSKELTPVEARNLKRKGDIETISSAMSRYLSNTGAKASDIPYLYVCGGMQGDGQPIGTAAGFPDFQALLVPTYLTMIPIDPQEGSTPLSSGYNACRTDDGKIRITASFAENGENISVER